jgi:hypothetical protein
MDSECKKVALIFSMDFNVIATSKRNIMRHLFPDSEIKSMALLRGTTQEAITHLSSQTSVEVDSALGDDLKICKVVTKDKFEDV